MLTLNDGRAELWQWDTGRTLAVDADCSQVHFSNKVFGRSIDVDVVNGTSIIPDILLQTDNDLNVWAFVGTSENGYTKISKTFTVNRRNKPADYVFTPTDQMTLQTIQSQIGDLSGLTTEAKDTLVDAINEVARSGGGAGSMDLRVEGGYVQYSRDGGMTWTNLIAMAELKGADGITPTIGDNGNWYLGSTDTGKPSRGATGSPGKDGAGMDVTGATVGQIAKISAVDASGVPTAWSPADIPSGGSSDFIINGAKYEDEPVVLDKTFAQIKEAVQSGKRAIVQMTSDGNVTIMPLIVNQSRLLLFSSMYNTGGKIFGVSLMVTSSNVTEYFISTPANNPDGTMPQVSMAAEPTEDMQIVTKKYVDDGLANKAPAGDYVTNSALNEKGYLTLDTLPKYGGESE